MSLACKSFCSVVFKRNIIRDYFVNQLKLKPVSQLVSSSRFKGHSHWQNIQRTKTKNDQIKSNVIMKYSRKVVGAYRTGGAHFATNARLQTVFDEAVREGVPLNTLQRVLEHAIKKPTDVHYYNIKGPGESCIIVECLTSNPRHTQNLLKGRAAKVSAAFAFDIPSVRDHFTHHGVIWILKVSTPVVEEDVEKKKSKAWSPPPTKQYPPPLTFDEAENLAIDINAESVSEIKDDDDREAFEILCAPDHVKGIESALSAKNYAVVKAVTEFRPVAYVKLSAQHNAMLEQFYELIQEYIEEVENVYDNVEDT